MAQTVGGYAAGKRLVFFAKSNLCASSWQHIRYRRDSQSLTCLHSVQHSLLAVSEARCMVIQEGRTQITMNKFGRAVFLAGFLVFVCWGGVMLGDELDVKSSKPKLLKLHFVCLHTLWAKKPIRSAMQTNTARG